MQNCAHWVWFMTVAQRKCKQTLTFSTLQFDFAYSCAIIQCPLPTTHCFKIIWRKKLPSETFCPLFSNVPQHMYRHAQSLGTTVLLHFLTQIIKIKNNKSPLKKSVIFPLSDGMIIYEIAHILIAHQSLKNSSPKSKNTICFSYSIKSTARHTRACADTH